MPCTCLAWRLTGLVRAATGRRQEAKASFRKALEMEPDLAQVHGSLEDVLKDEGLLDQAANCYRRAL